MPPKEFAEHLFLKKIQYIRTSLESPQLATTSVDPTDMSIPSNFIINVTETVYCTLQPESLYAHHGLQKGDFKIISKMRQMVFRKLRNHHKYFENALTVVRGQRRK